MHKNKQDVHSANLMDAFLNRFLLDGTFLGKYSKETMELINEILNKNNAKLEILDDDLEQLEEAAKQNDIFGLNYYQNMTVEFYDGESRINHNGNGKKGTGIFAFHGVGKAVHDPSIPTTDWDWNIFPRGIYDTLKRISNQYPNCKDIYITENGMGYKDKFISPKEVIDDQPRIDYIDKHLFEILKARKEGVNVKGYFVWSLQDQFSWANGYDKRYGIFYVDFKTQRRYIKKSAEWFRELSKTM